MTLEPTIAIKNHAAQHHNKLDIIAWKSFNTVLKNNNSQKNIVTFEDEDDETNIAFDGNYCYD